MPDAALKQKSVRLFTDLYNLATQITKIP